MLPKEWPTAAALLAMLAGAAAWIHWADGLTAAGSPAMARPLAVLIAALVLPIAATAVLLFRGEAAKACLLGTDAEDVI